MRADPLRDLLERTDAALPPPAIAGRFSERLAKRRAGRRRLQVAMSALLAMATVLAVLRFSKPHQRSDYELDGHAPAFDIDRCRKELAALQAEAAIHQQAADAIAAIRRQTDAFERSRDRMLLAPDPFDRIEHARDCAARILLLSGDRLTASSGHHQQATEEYRRAAALFPDTPAAEEAIQRLKAAGA